MSEKRWINEANDKAEVPEIDAFLSEIASVCRRHGLSISHEDGHGAFEIEEFSDSNIDWLQGAKDARRLGRTQSGLRRAREKAREPT